MQMHLSPDDTFTFATVILGLAVFELGICYNRWITRRLFVKEFVRQLHIEYKTGKEKER